jgi:hypothetical protein
MKRKPYSRRKRAPQNLSFLRTAAFTTVAPARPEHAKAAVLSNHTSLDTLLL